MKIQLEWGPEGDTDRCKGQWRGNTVSVCVKSADRDLGPNQQQAFAQFIIHMEKIA
jgi:hypothetical protein